MKVLYTLIFVIVSLLGVSQPVKEGIKAGFNFIQPNHSEYLINPGFQFGIYVERNLTRNFSYQYEAIIVRKGFEKYAGSVKEIENTSICFEIPLLLKYNRWSFVQPFIGVSATAKLWDKMVLTNDQILVNDLANFELGVLVGISVPFTEKLNIESRFVGTPILGNSGIITHHGFRVSFLYSIK